MLVLIDVPQRDMLLQPQIVWEEQLQSPAARSLDRVLDFAASQWGIRIIAEMLSTSTQSPLVESDEEAVLFPEPDFVVAGTIPATMRAAQLPDLDFEF